MISEGFTKIQAESAERVKEKLNQFNRYVWIGACLVTRLLITIQDALGVRRPRTLPTKSLGTRESALNILYYYAY